MSTIAAAKEAVWSWDEGVYNWTSADRGVSCVHGWAVVGLSKAGRMGHTYICMVIRGLRGHWTRYKSVERRKGTCGMSDLVQRQERCRQEGKHAFRFQQFR